MGGRASTLDLFGVSLVNARQGWAVGDIDPRGNGGAVYQTTDGGRSWHVTASKSEVFTTVRFIDAKTGWIAGYAGRIERTDDGGRSWRLQRSEREREIFNALGALDSRRALAVGARGLVLRTTDGGASWAQVETGRRDDFWAVRFASDSRAWIAGDHGTLLTTSDGGAHWFVVNGLGTRKALYGLAVLPPSTAVVVGEDGTILRSEDGIAWAPVRGVTSETFTSVAAAPPGVFWAVTQSGGLAASRDGGRTWSFTRAAEAEKLSAIDLADACHGLAAGRRGLVLVLE